MCTELVSGSLGFQTLSELLFRSPCEPLSLTASLWSKWLEYQSFPSNGQVSSVAKSRPQEVAGKTLSHRSHRST